LHVRVLYDKIPETKRRCCRRFCLLFAVGFHFGWSLTGLVAPTSFWRSPTGQKWLRAAMPARGGSTAGGIAANASPSVLLFGMLTGELIRLVIFDK